MARSTSRIIAAASKTPFCERLRMTRLCGLFANRSIVRLILRDDISRRERAWNAGGRRRPRELLQFVTWRRATATRNGATRASDR
jgi:hypothetical protein